MCVIILVEEEGQRPSARMLERAWEQNDDGFGAAWREPALDGNGLEVVWKKGIEDVKEAIEICDTIPIPYVAHFRAASPMFPVRQSLTHPFEVTERASYALEGRTKNPVLFHNGTWEKWANFSLDVAARSGVPIPVGPFSDTRAMAWLTAVMGEGFMNFLPDQRGVLFKTDDYEVFSGPGWKRYTDPISSHTFWCSNDRPWPTTHYGTTQQQMSSTSNSNSSQTTPARKNKMCYAPRCIREDLDKDGYCPLHPGGKLIQEATVITPTIPFGRDAIKEQKGSGGNSNVTPFPLTNSHTQGPLISVEQAEALVKQGKFTKGLAKEIRDCYSRMATGRKKQKVRSLLALRRATQLLTLLGQGTTQAVHLGKAPVM